MQHDNEHSIRERAYFLWEKEGRPEGRDTEFWERARLMHAAAAAPPVTTALQSRSPAEMAVDDAVAETFPASDPPAQSVATGVVSAPTAASKTIRAP